MGRSDWVIAEAVGDACRAQWTEWALVAGTACSGNVSASAASHCHSSSNASINRGQRRAHIVIDKVISSQTA